MDETDWFTLHFTKHDACSVLIVGFVRWCNIFWNINVNRMVQAFPRSLRLHLQAVTPVIKPKENLSDSS